MAGAVIQAERWKWVCSYSSREETEGTRVTKEHEALGDDPLKEETGSQDILGEQGLRRKLAKRIPSGMSRWLAGSSRGVSKNVRARIEADKDS